MADQDDVFSTLDDFLLSLADGITSAQDALTRASSLGPAARQYTYHLPRVDFELKFDLRVVEDRLLSQRYQSVRGERSSDMHLLFTPVKDAASSTLDIAAVVRGAFVAVPANNGLPGTLLRTAVESANRRRPSVQVTAVNAAGEPVEGLEVHFNVDRDESATLTAAAHLTPQVPPDGRFEPAVVITDAGGIARSSLTVADDQGPSLLAIVIDAAGRTETLVYEVPR